MASTESVMGDEKTSLLPQNKHSNTGTSYGSKINNAKDYDLAPIEAAFNRGIRPSMVGPGSYPLTLSWEHINVKVKVHGKGSCFGKSTPAYEKLILDDVSGIVTPGSFVAILGGSGSGKSTLLNVLTNRNTRHYMTTGSLRVNGVVIKNGIQNISAYVQQDELFMTTLTVREQLQFRALLRMDKSLDERARLGRVEEVIVEMGLTKCADSQIGTPGGTKTGISGGEKKRLSFASEALTGPPIFFCDEPTSSLDSYMAKNILQTLKGMATRGATILCTIHQPSSDLFAMFSQIILLSEGRMAFMGEKDNCANFFQQLGYPCPRHFNPADHYIKTLAIDHRNEEECQRKTGDICEAYKNSDAAKKIMENLNTFDDVNEKDRAVLDVVTSLEESSRYKPSARTQIVLLFWRAWISQFRNSVIFQTRVLVSLTTALIIGLVFLQLDVNQSGIMNICGVIFIAIFQLSMDDIYAVLTDFPEEMSLAMREFGTGLYELRWYYFTKTFAEIPMFCFTTFVFSTVIYWMAGLYDSAGAYLTWLGICVLLVLLSVNLGYLMSIALGETRIALNVVPDSLVLINVFGGYLVNTDDVPVYFKWLEFISWPKRSYSILMVNEWEDIGHIDCHKMNESCTFNRGQDVLDFYNIDKDGNTEDIIVMLSCFVGFYVMGYIALYIRGRVTKE